MFHSKLETYLEFHACWNNDWSEWKWVLADGCDQDSRNRGMNQWGTGRHRVGCWSGWRGNYQAITLNRDMLGKYLNFAFLKFVLDWQFVLVLSWLLRLVLSWLLSCGSRVGTFKLGHQPYRKIGSLYEFVRFVRVRTLIKTDLRTVKSF